MQSFRKRNHNKREELQPQAPADITQEFNACRSKQANGVSPGLAVPQDVFTKLPTTSGIMRRHSELKKQLLDDNLSKKFLMLKKKKEFRVGTPMNTGVGNGDMNSAKAMPLPTGTMGFASTPVPSKQEVEIQQNVPKPHEFVDHRMLESVVSYIEPVALPRTLDLKSKPKPVAQVKQRPANTYTMAKGKKQLPPTAEEQSTVLMPPTQLGPTLEQFAATLSELECLHQSHEMDDAPHDPSITIIVCDEVRRATCEFICTQSMLTKHMGYFADISKIYDMKDIDISVNCDIVIFDWLINWIKFESLTPTQRRKAARVKPSLNTANVSAVLMASWSLQMQPLYVMCLNYCRDHLHELVRIPFSLQDLDDAMFERLARLLNNEELEQACVEHEHFTAKLWTCFIQRLGELTPDNAAGHYYSLASLMRCSRCHKYVPSYIESCVSCTPGHLHLNRWGQFIYTHERDHNWKIDKYIEKLYKELKSWRLVYWKLWCKCHFLFCKKCEMHFAVDELMQCPAHAGAPITAAPHFKDPNTQLDRYYSCCGQQAYEFETFQLKSGCCAHAHRVEIVAECDKNILCILEKISFHKQIFNTKKFNKEQLESTFPSIKLVPERKDSSILPAIAAEKDYGVWRTTADQSSAYKYNSHTAPDSAESVQTWQRLNMDSGDDDNDVDLMKWQPKKTIPMQSDASDKTAVRVSGRYWDNTQPMHYNQDNQREFEEKVMKHITESVRKKLGCKEEVETPPIGGTFARMEAEWLEAYRKRQLEQSSDNPMQSPASPMKQQTSKLS